VKLTPLSRQGIASLVSSMLGSKDAPEALADWVFSASRGCPGTAEELVRQLAARGHLKRLGKKLICELPEQAQVLSSLSVPETLASQIRGLPEAELKFLEVASVAGSVFSLETVTRLMAGQPESVAAAAGDLMEKGLIRHAGPGLYAFSHALAAPLASGLIPVEVKKKLHAEMARLLEEDGADTNAGLLAEHYEESGQAEKAEAARLSAARAAFEGGRYEEAHFQA